MFGVFKTANSQCVLARTIRRFYLFFRKGILQTRNEIHSGCILSFSSSSWIFE